MPAETKYCTITISGLPENLRGELEQWAAEEHRDRSSQCVKLIEDALIERRVAKSKRKAA